MTNVELRNAIIFKAIIIKLTERSDLHNSSFFNCRKVVSAVHKIFHKTFDHGRIL
jgi:hypothetical protein